MNLSQEERRIIFEEEKAKERQAKLNSLSEEDRKKIYLEESVTKTVKLNNSMIVGPQMKGWKYWIPYLSSTIIFSLILTPIIGFIVGSIVFGIIYFILSTFVNQSLAFPIVYFNCPYCSSNMWLRLEEKPKYETYLKNNQTHPATCPKCKRDMSVEYSYLESIKITNIRNSN